MLVWMKRLQNCHWVGSEMLHITIYSQNGVLYITLYKHWNRHTRRNQLWNWNETETNFVELKRFLLSISLRAFLCVCLLCRGTRAYECILTDGDGCGSVWAIFANKASIRRRVKCKEMHTTEKRYFELHRQTTHTHTHHSVCMLDEIVHCCCCWLAGLVHSHQGIRISSARAVCMRVFVCTNEWVSEYERIFVLLYFIARCHIIGTTKAYLFIMRWFDDSTIRSFVRLWIFCITFATTKWFLRLHFVRGRNSIRVFTSLCTAVARNFRFVSGSIGLNEVAALQW